MYCTVTACYIKPDERHRICDWSRSIVHEQNIFRRFESFEKRWDSLLGKLQVYLNWKKLYLQCVSAQNTPYLNFICFMDVLKVFMAFPGVSKTDHVLCRLVTSAYCLPFFSKTNSDGVLFYMYGPGERQYHNITTYREFGTDVQKQVRLLVN